MLTSHNHVLVRVLTFRFVVYPRRMAHAPFHEAYPHRTCDWLRRA